MKAWEVVLLVPAVYLALSLDRIQPDRFKPVLVFVSGLEQTAPMLAGVNEGRFGRPGEPLNVMFVGASADLRDALRAAGWTEVPTALREALAAGLTPMRDYRLLGRHQSMNWEISVRPFAERHRLRLWRTGMAHPDGREVWWGSAGYDASFRWSALSHVPDPDLDRERDFVVKSLSAPGLAQSSTLVPLPQIPAEGVDDEGYPYRTDGRAAVIALKRPGPARSAR